jgi:hypothetical protein
LFTPSRPSNPAKSHIPFGSQPQTTGHRWAGLPPECATYGFSGQLDCGWVEADGAVELVTDGLGGE